ncbi:MAG TPA: histidine phosphatase family protein [Blastocatellia bacterium]|nr:histidine phosphatase family protein [Blastocatellia bacterium]
MNVKTLLLMRHAKSNWDDASLRDFDRPLAERGRRDAPRMAQALAALDSAPDCIVSSPARRARETIEAVITEARLTAPLTFDEAIYDASTAALMRIVRRLPDECHRVLLVGHNPGFEDLLTRLSGERGRMPTAAIACIEFQVDSWDDVEDGHGKLVWLLTPKQLRKDDGEIE